MKHIAFLLVTTLFSFSIQGQVLPNLKELTEKLERYHDNQCTAMVIYDSIIEVSYHEKLKIGKKDVYSATDSMDYKLYFIFRKEKNQLQNYINSMKILAAKIDSVKAIDSSSVLFRSLIDKPSKWGVVLPYKIPPTIINENYSVVIIDNIRHSSCINVKQEYLLWYLYVIDKILIVGEENIICSYSQYMSSFMKTEMMGNFDLFDWGYIKEMNYYRLFRR